MRLIAILSLSLLAACTTTNDTPVSSAADAPEFRIVGADVSSMTRANLCRDLNGQGTPPTVTIRHTPVAGVPIRVRMYDNLSNGTTFEHRRTTVRSDASGTTTVNHRFLPPCNTTGGRLDSSYQFDMTAAGQTFTKGWADYDSGADRIN